MTVKEFTEELSKLNENYDLKKEVIDKSFEWLEDNYLEDKYWSYGEFDLYTYLFDFRRFMEDEL